MAAVDRAAKAHTRKACDPTGTAATPATTTDAARNRRAGARRGTH